MNLIRLKNAALRASAPDHQLEFKLLALHRGWEYLRMIGDSMARFRKPDDTLTDELVPPHLMSSLDRARELVPEGLRLDLTVTKDLKHALCVLEKMDLELGCVRKFIAAGHLAPACVSVAGLMARGLLPSKPALGG